MTCGACSITVTSKPLHIINQHHTILDLEILGHLQSNEPSTDNYSLLGITCLNPCFNLLITRCDRNYLTTVRDITKLEHSREHSLHWLEEWKDENQVTKWAYHRRPQNYFSRSYLNLRFVTCKIFNENSFLLTVDLYNFVICFHIDIKVLSKLLLTGYKKTFLLTITFHSRSDLRNHTSNIIRKSTIGKCIVRSLFKHSNRCSLIQTS